MILLFALVHTKNFLICVCPESQWNGWNVSMYSIYGMIIWCVMPGWYIIMDEFQTWKDRLWQRRRYEFGVKNSECIFYRIVEKGHSTMTISNSSNYQAINFNSNGRDWAKDFGQFILNAKPSFDRKYSDSNTLPQFGRCQAHFRFYCFN